MPAIVTTDSASIQMVTRIFFIFGYLKGFEILIVLLLVAKIIKKTTLHLVQLKKFLFLLRLFKNYTNSLNINTMKKTLMIALAGIMLFAFTQCGGNKGSKEFQDNKALFEKLEKAINDSQTCDELEDAALNILFSSLAVEEYAEEDKMTEAEQAEIEKLGEKLEKVMEAKVAKLGCEEENEEPVEETIEETVEEVQ